MTYEGIRHLEGGCACRNVRYRLTAPPMFVHCCHCRWCQRETGSAFVLNALIEAGSIELEKGKPEVVNTPSAQPPKTPSSTSRTGPNALLTPSTPAS